MNRFFLAFALLFIAFDSFSQTYEELVSKSADYVEAKEYAAAEEVLKLAMRKEPGNQGNVLLLCNLGTIQRRLGKTDEALISYNSALSKFPSNTLLLQNRAALFCEIDSLDAAKRDYDIILSYDNDNTEALYRRGLIYVSEKNYLAAETDFDRILSIDPDNTLAENSLALVMKSKGDWDSAEEKYTDLIYKYKNVPDFYIGRAECYLELKKLARAKSDLQKALELKSEDPLLYIIKGRLNLRQFDKFNARQDFLKAQELGANEDIIKEYLTLCK